MLAKSPRKTRCLTFNPTSEICWFDKSEPVECVNNDYINAYCNIDFNAILPTRNPVIKLYSLIQTDYYKIQGYIIVENLSYEKKVYIRYTTTDWKNFNEIECKFYKSLNPQIDMFEFTEYLYPSYRAEFAIRYQVNECEYWDNNEGSNFIINPYVHKNQEINNALLYTRFSQNTEDNYSYSLCMDNDMSVSMLG